jgi:hypothetical protein
MTDHRITSYYMSRRLDVPPHVARAAFDELHYAGGLGPWSLRTARWTLTLKGPVRVSVGESGQAYRVQRGLLRGPLRRMPVELELQPWSSTRTELGLRPLTRNLQVAERCLMGGLDVLGVLAGEMCRWADLPLVERLDSPALDEVGDLCHGRDGWEQRPARESTWARWAAGARNSASRCAPARSARRPAGWR